VEAASAAPGLKPCRYGLDCTRPNCKFWHGSKPVQYSADFKGVSSNHWVPIDLYLKIRPEGGVACIKPEDDQQEVLQVLLGTFDRD
jgi:hypothetical protein